MTDRASGCAVALVLAIVGGVAGCGAAPGAAPPKAAVGAVGALVVSDGRIAEPIGANPAVLYFTIGNRGLSDDALVAVTVEGAGRSDIHRTSRRGSLAWMEPAAEIAIPAGASVDFAPGGNHVMVQGGEKRLRRGARVSVRLVFRRAGSLDFPVPVLVYRDLDRVLAGAGKGARQRPE